LSDKGVSARRVQMVHRLIHKVLADAVRWGVVASNVASTVQPPKWERKQETLWTPEQIKVFLDAVEAGQCEPHGDLFVFLLASGCRLGEALGLRWSHVNLNTGHVRIDRQVTQVGN